MLQVACKLGCLYSPPSTQLVPLEIGCYYSGKYAKAELLETWLVLTSIKYHDNLLVLILLNRWLVLTMLRSTGPRSKRILNHLNYFLKDNEQPLQGLKSWKNAAVPLAKFPLNAFASFLPNQFWSLSLGESWYIIEPRISKFGKCMDFQM